ncbi:MAG: GFA family protein [bacterium]|nr:MAG: GFA family protein [bacterium]
MSTGSDNQVKAGGCLCGSVRYRITGDLRGVVNCHCSKCRRFHGNYAAYVGTKPENLAIIEEGGLKWFRSTADETPNVHRGFCGDCGSSLFWHPRGEDRIAVAAGSLDGPTDLRIIGHVWVSQMADYYGISDDLPKYAEGWERSEQVP